MIRIHWAIVWVFFTMLSLGCASTEKAASVSICDDRESLQPLPEVGSCSAGELEAFTAALAERIEPHAGPLLVRVEFDQASKPARYCTDRASLPGEWRTRRDLAAVLASSSPLPPGPACLAGRRLDANRRAATLGKVRRAELDCRSFSGNSASRTSNRAAVAAADYRRCLLDKADWLLFTETGILAPMVFAAPESQAAEPLSAEVTLDRCMRTTGTARARVACIQEEGWEFLP